MSLIGYKGFNKDLTCLDFQYQVGQTHTMTEAIELCARGFHFCQYPLDVLHYYNCEDHVYAKVLARDQIIKDNTKCVTNCLTILELLTREQLVEAMPSHLVRDNGTHEWYVEGKLHRSDGPAVEWSTGTKAWYVDGKRHRLDGPAVEKADGTMEWYVEGKRHRPDGPAFEDTDGNKEWYVEGKRHRLDGPAIEEADGTKVWYVEGQLHRSDGPAIEWASGKQEWYVKGKRHPSDGSVVEELEGNNYVRQFM